MGNPATAPAMVLRVWVGRPERPRGLAAVHAHPMTWATAGAAGPRWDSGHSPELGALASLMITTDVGRDGAPEGWRAEYRELRPVNASRAGAMLRTLGALRRGLEQAAARHGPPAGVAEHLARAAAALQVTGSPPFAAYQPPPRGSRDTPGQGWHRYDTATLPAWLQQQFTRQQDLQFRDAMLTEDLRRGLEMG